MPRIPPGELQLPTGERIPFERLTETARAAIAGKKTVLLDYDAPDLPDADRAVAVANSARLVLFVPLMHHEEVIGHVSLDQPGGRYDFSAEQIRVLESIAAQAAIALEHAREFEREHHIAEALQHAVLTPPEEVPGLEVAYWYQPATASTNVGGDFYDVIDLGDGRAAFLIGDVAGKGVEAARLSTLIRDGVRAYVLVDSEPSGVLARVNALAYRFTAPNKFATAILGVIDTASGHLCYSSAGHPPAIVAGDGDVSALPGGMGLLGALPDTEFRTFEAMLAPGEVLCLYTDGITEARRGQQLFAEDGVVEALRRLRGTSVASLPGALLSEVVAFAQGYLRDDIIILCIGRRARAV